MDMYNTNMVFVNGYDDVRLRPQIPNSTMLYLDNDKPVLYKKTMDQTGQYSIQEYTITEKKSQLDELKDEVSMLRAQLASITSQQSTGGNSNESTQN